MQWYAGSPQMNSMGDSGSPWRKPLACENGFPGSPLRRILEVAKASERHIQSLQIWPNPKALIISRR
jgi:hypothetical protein